MAGGTRLTPGSLGGVVRVGVNSGIVGLAASEQNESPIEPEAEHEFYLYGIPLA